MDLSRVNEFGQRGDADEGKKAKPNKANTGGGKADKANTGGGKAKPDGANTGGGQGGQGQYRGGQGQTRRC